jgi:hypothetical protein
MNTERFFIEITSQHRPHRTVVTVQPRTVAHHPSYFALEDHALAFADKLARENGWRIVDRREGPGR